MGRVKGLEEGGGLAGREGGHKGVGRGWGPQESGVLQAGGLMGKRVGATGSVPSTAVLLSPLSGSETDVLEPLPNVEVQPRLKGHRLSRLVLDLLAQAWPLSPTRLHWEQVSLPVSQPGPSSLCVGKKGELVCKP